MFIRNLHDALPMRRIHPATRHPAFENTSRIVILSDYSGRGDRWGTAAFFCFPEEELKPLTARLDEVRRTARIPDGRRFEYKSLRDKLKWRVLPEWLGSFDATPGFAFVLLMDAQVVSAFHSNKSDELAEVVTTIKDAGFGDWSSTSSGARLLEESLRLMHCVAYIHAYLSAGRLVPLTWLTDNDEVFDGALRRSSFEQLFPNVLEKYSGVSVPFTFLTEKDEAAAPLSQLLSLPDLLAAGVLEHQRGVESNATEMIAKAAVIAEWLGSEHELCKIAFRIRPGEDVGLKWEIYKPSFKPTGVAVPD